jgi:hypothetical protein
MYAASAQANKLRRLINTHGGDFYFSKPELNEFGEPSGNTVSVTIRGVYHEETSYSSKSSTEASTIRKKDSPMILCLWEDAQRVADDSLLKFNDHTYSIGGIKNLAEANIIGDISLEEVQTHG